jgi:hypothetical protein
LSQGEHSVVLRNYEGYIARYEEPEQYASHNAESCTFCKAQRPGAERPGVIDLLQGEIAAIKPEGFDRIHSGDEKMPVVVGAPAVREIGPPANAKNGRGSASKH